MNVASVSRLIGIVDFNENDDGNINQIFNAAAIVVDRQIVAIYHKNELPNYGVFDELRYFTPGTTCQIIDINGIPVGVNICEDIWVNPGVGDAQCVAGAKLILTLNSSPYEIGKLHTRIDLVTDLAKRHQAYAVYTNQVGGQDERPSRTIPKIIIKPAKIIAPRYNTAAKTRIPAPDATFQDDISQVYAALTLGTRDYIHKTGFQKVAIALSGGIDSSIVACIAADAIGPENIVGVGMPSRYSSEGSLIDAQDLADRLKIPLWRIPIEPAHAAFEQMLAETFHGHEANTAEENVQSRIRGNMATGYATLYGDMAGGFAVIKDIPKQLVYQLSAYRNRIDDSPPIPQSVIEKPPTAELRPDQLDVDSLPPYDQLDPLLRAYIEERRSSEEILEELEGVDHATAARILRMVDINEYKRRQSPPGVKVTGLAFGRDRRMPIASRWRH
ncbi:Glutamine-dependent NAD(+) synthetase [Geodia barretti]|uniref:Glutamine-dependent NAD(+) synthetase n=1 Tax=Geodia barretti TaxID=519541 RepID=A0AA35W4Z5_GEOBA|nr:Glutamine-dependent NAD(+) synthetase [Geodia barretti]